MILIILLLWWDTGAFCLALSPISDRPCLLVTSLNGAGFNFGMFIVSRPILPADSVEGSKFHLVQT